MTAAQAFIPHFSPLSASRTAPSHSCSCASKVTSSFVRQRPRLIFNKADNKANFGTWRGKGLVMVVNGAGASGKGRALIFDCDGVCGQCFYIVIVESEELHRVSYNKCWRQENLGFEWDYEFYEMLQNSVGGGKEKMYWYFRRYGWPDDVKNEDDVKKKEFVLRLHGIKTEMYMDLINNGEAKIREGILRIIDEAYEVGYKLAICSAANAKAVGLVLDRLIGEERLKKFDVILAGDAVSKKKPDPTIYNVAMERLGVDKENCVVIEDSQIGLQAALAAGMRCVITHTPYTASQKFDGASLIVPTLGDAGTSQTFLTVEDLFATQPAAASKF